MTLHNPEAFFDAIRQSTLMGPTLSPQEVEGLNAILTACAAEPLSWASYELATTFHETAGTMKPIRERGSGDGPDADPWDDYLEKYDTGRLAAALGNTPEADGDGVRLAGNGYVQITGARNYKRANKRLHELGILKPEEDLFKSPELALRPDVAAAILVYGMREGWFTGASLKNYLPTIGMATRLQFKAARRVINGTDRDELIAGHAMIFQGALGLGAWA